MAIGGGRPGLSEQSSACPYAEPQTFLFLRMFGAVLLLGAIVLIARPKWPNREAMLDSCDPWTLLVRYS
jgi:hypothetical protein